MDFGCIVLAVVHVNTNYLQVYLIELIDRQIKIACMLFASLTVTFWVKVIRQCSIGFIERTQEGVLMSDFFYIRNFKIN